MAPRRRKRIAPGETRPYKIMLPQDISDRIDQKAKAKGWPLARVIINELGLYPRLEEFEDFANQIADMKIVLARHSARIQWQDLSEQLLKSVDAVLKAEGSTALQAAVDKLRIDRAAMLKTKTTGADQ